MLDKLLLNVSSSENKDFIIKVPDHGKDSVSTCSSMDLEPERHKCFSTSHPHLSRNSVRREDSGPRVCEVKFKKIIEWQQGCIWSQIKKYIILWPKWKNEKQTSVYVEEM